ncbi:MAG: gamma-glutamyl-gamma-aminobutyrate hydrolase family protein [Agathobaculum sp.]|uniref:gamma-glutamyl-gamma-aminobutyrate hydrolase family protein n=1 Tax=Agathobaculum sp. TaxID=2048138 RepID=UPI003D8A981A
MQSPLILISTNRNIGNLSISRQQSELYGACLEEAGGTGVLYTRGSAQRLAAHCDALLLAGGGDLHPALYGQAQTTESRISIDTTRDAEEQALFEAFFRRRKPILGICRGIQALNVFLGGTLRQHISGHMHCCHAVSCGESLQPLIGSAPKVNSYHHQTVDCIAPDLSAAACAPDGTVEALIHVSAPILGVQWHPERMVPPHCDDVEGENHLSLFQWLIERC